MLTFDLVKESNTDFIRRNKHLLTGRVLDFGCGYQSHKQFCTGEYIGYDPGYSDYDTGDNDKRIHLVDWSGHFDTVLLSQVLQTLDNPIDILKSFDTDHLILTVVTTWREYEPCDKYRYTMSGIKSILNRSGYTIIKHEPLCVFEVSEMTLNFGHGVICEKR